MIFLINHLYQLMRLEKITYPLKRIVNDYKLNKKTSPIITMVLPL